MSRCFLWGSRDGDIESILGEDVMKTVETTTKGLEKSTKCVGGAAAGVERADSSFGSLWYKVLNGISATESSRTRRVRGCTKPRYSLISGIATAPPPPAAPTVASQQPPPSRQDPRRQEDYSSLKAAEDG